MLIAKRTFATLKDIQIRLKAIKNIGKITNSMKMIASTRLNKAQRQMEMANFYKQVSCNVLKHLESGVFEEEENRDFISTALKEDWEKDLSMVNPPIVLVACSSDRGLCGAIHSSISKAIKHLMLEGSNSSLKNNASIVILGEKVKPQLSRVLASSISMHFNGIGKTVPSMSEAISILDRLTSGIGGSEKNPNVVLICNRFISVIAFETTVVPLISDENLIKSPKLFIYEYSDEEVINLAEYLRNVRFYQALAEGHVAELSAKRTAMENATKNTVEMTESLTMKYNRTRQAVITNELVDIITGASAL